MAGLAITLAIETSNPSAWEESVPIRPGVAAVSGKGVGDSQVLGVEEIDPTRRHEDDLMPAIQRLAERVGFRPSDVSRLAVSAGPGGFTAVRMALTVAKSIADATGAACIPVPTAVSVAAAAVGMGRAGATVSTPFAVALASKDDSLFLARFDASGQPAGPGRVVRTHEISWSGIGVLVADRFLPPGCFDSAVAAGVSLARPVFDPVACARASWSFQSVDPARAEVIYPRPPEAIRKWEQLHGRGDPPVA